MANNKTSRRETAPANAPAQDRRALFEEMLQIDEHALDVELVEQPDLYYRVSKNAALAMSRRDQAKTMLAEAEAEAEREARRDAELAKEKVTVSEVQQTARLSKTVREAQAHHSTLIREAALWAALERAFELRSRAIGKLSDLWIAGYYTKQSGSVARNAVKGDKAEQAREAMAEMRKQRGRP